MYQDKSRNWPPPIKNLSNSTIVKTASLMPINGLPVLVSPLAPIKFMAPPSSVVSPSPAKRHRALMPEAQTKITRAYTKPGADDEALCTFKLELDVTLLKAQTNATPMSSNIKRDVVS